MAIYDPEIVFRATTFNIIEETMETFSLPKINTTPIFRILLKELTFHPGNVF